MFAIITMPYDRTAMGFDDEMLNQFLVNKQLKSHQAKFFMDNQEQMAPVTFVLTDFLARDRY